MIFERPDVSTESLPGAENDTASSPLPSPRVEVVVKNECFWIHNALNIEEQIKVFGDILERSKSVDNTQKQACMYPSPKTLLFDGHKSSLHFGKKRDNDKEIENDGSTSSLISVFDELILRRAAFLVSQHVPGKNENDTKSGLDYNRYSVGVIRYAAPNGSFPDHIDHCNNPNGWVILLSLGCKARFSVQKKFPRNKTNNGAATSTIDTEKVILELKSGDVLVFDPSTEASIQHGVNSILPSTCPVELVDAFGEKAMSNQRYGVQCRTSLEQ